MALTGGEMLAAGARANDGLAGAADIACDDGVLVDEFAHWCAASTPSAIARGGRAGAISAAAILGKPVACDPVPWFWSNHCRVKLQSAGLGDRYESCNVIGNPAEARFSVEYRRHGRLIAVDTLNDSCAHMTARRRIAEETAPPNEACTSEGAA